MLFQLEIVCCDRTCRKRKTVKKLIALAALGLVLMACDSNRNAQVSGASEMLRLMDEMDRAEQKANERARHEFLIFMSLETMFPDPQVRALAKAAGEGDIARIDELVAAGVDVDARGARNATPLFWAFANADGFRRLLELGADPNVMYDDGGTIMHWAVNHNEDIFLKLALRFGGDPNLVGPLSKETPLFDAMGPDHRSKIPILLDAGADMNFQSMVGDTPMMVAAGLGQFDIVYDFLERGADFRIRNSLIDGTLMDRIAFRRRTMTPNSNLSRWMEKVIAWLAERGEEIPVWKDPALQ
jgi:hypothetical protein